MTFRKYLVLLGVMLFASLGDMFLSRGMKQVGEVSISDLPRLIHALGNPWVAAGIVLLIAFFISYLSALSWADLTYVLPATAIGYVVLALGARFWLGESIPVTRWIGILMIVAGVGFVAGGPEVTKRSEKSAVCEAEEVRS